MRLNVGVILAEPQLAQIATIIAAVGMVALGSELFGNRVGILGYVVGYVVVAMVLGVLALGFLILS